MSHEMRLERDIFIYSNMMSYEIEFENINTCDALKFFEIFCGGEKKNLNIPNFLVDES